MIFIRHPVTEAPKGMCYGRMDLGLGDGADVQIASALDACPRTAQIVSSPAKRCRALAEALAARNGASTSYDDRLWEMSFGKWEGMMWTDIPRAESDPWAEDFWNIAPPGGETFSTVYDRVHAALGDIPKDAVVVTHGGVIRAARMILQGASLDQIWNEPVPFASPLVLTKVAA